MTRLFAFFRPVLPMRSHPLPILALLISVLCGCAYTVVHDGAVNHSKAQEIETGIERFRDLKFTSEVPLVVKTRDQAQAMMLKEILRDHTEDEMHIGSLSGAMTGVYPAGMDLKTETLKMLRSQIAGFYDPHDKQMVLVEGAVDVSLWSSAAGLITHRDLTGEMLLAHELTHALQDQHFHIEQMIDKVKNNDDRDLALKSVAEGDATLAGYGYVMGNLDDASIAAVVDRMKDLPKTFATQTADVPIGLSAPMIFQYVDGVRFVAEAYRRGGWAAVNAIYTDPPRATLQIMYPNLYFDHHTQLVDIDLNGYRGVLKDWAKVDDDTYGAMLIKLIIQRNLGMSVPEITLADRWTGDRIIILQKDHALTVLWIVSFRTNDTAAKFASTYKSILARTSTAGTTYHVQVKSSNVLIAIGDGARQFDQLAPAVWHASTITPVPMTPALPASTYTAHD